MNVLSDALTTPLLPVPLLPAPLQFSGCLYYALLNLGADEGLSMSMAMVPYVAFDVFALRDTAHWTGLCASFIVLDGAMGAVGLKSYLATKAGREKTA